MMIIGLLLVVAAVVVGTGVVIGNSESASLEIFDREITDLTGAGVFLLGAATAAVLLIGLWMIAAGLRKSRRRRLEVRQARREREEVLRQQEEDRRALETERERLAEEKARLEDERTGEPRQADSSPEPPGATRVMPRANAPERDERSVQR